MTIYSKNLQSFIQIPSQSLDIIATTGKPIFAAKDPEKQIIRKLFLPYLMKLETQYKP